MQPVLLHALRAETWKERESALGEAYSLVGEMHNALGVTRRISTRMRPYFNRPFQVIAAYRFANALQKRIENPNICRLPLVGGMDQLSDSTDITSYSRQGSCVCCTTRGNSRSTRC